MRLSISMMAFALLTAGFLWPTEEAISGLGLHLVVLWMLLGFLHAMQCWWATDGAHARRPQFDRIDLGVLLIAVGHVISTLVVFQLDGDRRAALNLTFEWIGLLIAWRILRSLFVDQRVAAQSIAVVTALCVGLSCFGIWQHHVFYAEQSEWYRSLRSELDQALAGGDPSQITRANEITRQFQEQEIPLDGSSRIGWENRLLSSSEPFPEISMKPSHEYRYPGFDAGNDGLSARVRGFHGAPELSAGKSSQLTVPHALVYPFRDRLRASEVSLTQED